MITHQQFLEQVRSVLNHLYDPDFLNRSVLAHYLGVAGKFDTSLALQQCITKAIESLKLKPGDMLKTQNQRAYDLLLFRYVQKLTQDEVASQFGISDRQLRREQNTAIKLLAYRLWEQYQVSERMAEIAMIEPPYPEALTPFDDLAWIKDQMLEHPVDPNQELAAVLELARSFCDRSGAKIEVSLPDTFLPGLAVHPVAFRQILLSVLGWLIQRAKCQHLHIKIFVETRQVAFHLEGKRAEKSLRSETIHLDAAQRMAELSGGSLQMSENNLQVFVSITLPVFEQITVLVLDDNRDMLQLLQRYAAGTRYHVIGTSDTEQITKLAETTAAQIILLDVMMPQSDGWTVLERLRAYPATANIPIIICTILDQEDLAISLGAQGFIHKPVSRGDFLAALENIQRG